MCLKNKMNHSLILKTSICNIMQNYNIILNVILVGLYFLAKSYIYMKYFF